MFPSKHLQTIFFIILILGLALHRMDLGLGFGLGPFFIFCLLLILRRLEGRTSSVMVNGLFLH